MRNFHQRGIDTRGRISGKIKTICPQCNDTRGHKGNKSLSVDLDKGLCYCHHCGYKLYVPDDAEERLKQQRRDMHRKPTAPPQHFRRPTFDPARMQLSENLERYWTTVRCLPQELLRTLRITEETVRLPESSQEENCICFNYFENGTLVNTKYRSALKHFMMVKGAELILQRGQHPGHPGVHHHRRRVRRGSHHRRRTQGRRLRARRRPEQPHVAGPLRGVALRRQAGHLHRRRRGLGRAVAPAGTHAPPRSGTLPHRALRRGLQGCQRVSGEIRRRKPPHLHRASRRNALEGIFTAEDCGDDLRSLYENGLQRGADTGWENFDEHCTFEPRRLLVMTGRPGDGKSEFTDELVLRLCLRHEWKIAFFSPENMPIAYHLHKLAEKLTGHRFTPGPGMTEALYGQAVGWLDRNVSHILPDDGSYGIDHILEKARQVVRRKGVRILVIDPMNRLEQRLEPGQTEMDYITDTLNKLGRFATRNQCLVILVAHPRKVNRNEKDGTRRRVEMNDINGSANFANMSDFCLVVDRNDTKQIATIYIEKVRFKHLGSAHTEAKFVYNHLNGRYWPCEEDVIHTPQGEQLGPVNTQFDNENWLKNNEEQGRLFE